MPDGAGDEPPRKPHASARTSSAAEPHASAADWITIWQSELAGMAGDRELHDAWLRWVALWGETAQRALRLMPHAAAPVNGPAGSAGSAPAAGSTPPVAAPDPRDAALQRLANRVEELERQLARLAAPGTGSNSPGHDGGGTGGA